MPQNPQGMGNFILSNTWEILTLFIRHENCVIGFLRQPHSESKGPSDLQCDTLRGFLKRACGAFCYSHVWWGDTSMAKDCGTLPPPLQDLLGTFPDQHFLNFLSHLTVIH